MRKHFERLKGAIEKRALKPVVTKGLGAAAMLGNLLVGAYELNTTTAENIPHWKDGAHNEVDGAVYGAQAAAAVAGRRISPKISHAVERMTSNSLFISGLGGIAYASYLMAEAIHGNGQTEFHGPSLTSAASSLALTVGLATWTAPSVYKKGLKSLSPIEKGWVDHIKTDGASAGLAVASSLPFNTPATIAGAGLVASAYEAWTFRPWRDHDHAHGFTEEPTKEYGSGERAHPHAHAHEKRDGRWWKRLAVGSFAVASCIGVGAMAQEAPTSLAPSIPAVVQPDSELPVQDIYSTQSVMIDPGDSQWSIAKQEITESTGVAVPEEHHVYEVTQHMIESNPGSFSNPHVIHPGTVLAVPSIAAIQAIVNQ